MVNELAKKADFYGIKKEWAELEVVPIINTPSYGDLTAPFLARSSRLLRRRMLSSSWKPRNFAYGGFLQGTMLVGDFKGEKVEAPKPKVRDQLIAAGEAFAYAEPENKVTSRSGDDCTVALMDQWYLDYGEESWREQALEYVEGKDGKGLNTYSNETRHAFIGVLNWLNQWACAPYGWPGIQAASSGIRKFPCGIALETPPSI